MPTGSFTSATVKSKRTKKSGRPAGVFGLRSALLILAGVWVIYFAVLHPWFMNWGATAAEQRMALPGDELLPPAATWFTRAITIHAPASTVWRWIVQIGQDRAGFYSNTWLENLSGAGIHNADTIHPEWQHRAIGDHVLLARPDLLWGWFAKVARTPIVAVEPERMIAQIPNRFALQPLDSASTRLFLRESVPSSFGARVANALLWDPIHFVMEQRMLRGIKERAEGVPLVSAVVVGMARTGWIVAGAGLVALFIVRRRQGLWILLAILPALPIVMSTGDRSAALAAFLAIGVTVLGALAFGRRWWPGYVLLASAVALILLVAQDPYTVFGIALGVTSTAVLRAGLSLRNGSSAVVTRPDS